MTLLRPAMAMARALRRDRDVDDLADDAGGGDGSCDADGAGAEDARLASDAHEGYDRHKGEAQRC